MSDNRFNQLEMTIAEQDQSIQDLSDMVNRQWQEIEKLQARLTHTQSRIISLEENAPASSSVEKPPHY
jgi:SlyX protein